MLRGKVVLSSLGGHVVDHSINVRVVEGSTRGAIEGIEVVGHYNSLEKTLYLTRARSVLS